jgi:SEC-C motif
MFRVTGSLNAMPVSSPILRIGRNEKCPCGSGKKYKHCHGNPAHPEFGQAVFIDTRRADIDQKWIIFARDVKDILKIKTPGDWWEARKTFGSDQVTAIYRAYAQLFPPDINLLKTINVDKDKLSALYAGEIGPTEIDRNIVRFSLYSEKIYAFDPFHPPHLMMPGGVSPRTKPEEFLLETFKCSYFVCRVLPWIEAGIVSLVPNPSNLDMQYRKHDLEQTTKRIIAAVMFMRCSLVPPANSKPRQPGGACRGRAARGLSFGKHALPNGAARLSIADRLASRLSSLEHRAIKNSRSRD